MQIDIIGLETKAGAFTLSRRLIELPVSQSRLKLTSLAGTSKGENMLGIDKGAPEEVLRPIVAVFETLAPRPKCALSPDHRFVICQDRREL